MRKNPLRRLPARAGFGIVLALAGAAADPPELTARITQLGGAVEIAGPGVVGLPVATPWQITRTGTTIRVPAKGYAGVVCSNRRFVRLRGPVRWSVSEKTCAAGKPLTEAEYSLVAPRAGRFQVVAGILVLEREIRGESRGDARVPVIVSPRDTLLRSLRPTVRWIRVPSADEYFVEWRQGDVDGPSFRLAATEVSCRLEPDGLDLCTFPWPHDAPALDSGRSYRLTVSARDRETRVWNGDPSVEVSTPSDSAAAELEADLAGLEHLGLEGPALDAARAGLLARRGCFSDAADAYRQVISRTPAPELGVTLADLYLATRLNFLAEPLYHQALAAESALVRAAAAFGLGRVEYEKKSYRDAAAHFDQARQGFADLGLAEEEAAAGHASKKAAAKPP